MSKIDIVKLHKNIPSYQDRLREPQIDVPYGLFIYQKQIINLTTATKRKKPITQIKYNKINRKPYKNLMWLNRMYDRKIKEMAALPPEDKDQLYKIILPLEYRKGYKIFDHNGDYYATIMDKDDIFCYLAVKKDTNQIYSFLNDSMEKMYLQAQCEGKYGFTVPLEFYKNYERPG